MAPSPPRRAERIAVVEALGGVGVLAAVLTWPIQAVTHWVGFLLLGVGVLLLAAGQLLRRRG